ncbi:hypothetical protein BIFADO_00337 [Bifidobacterium adolescentis L2-32]|uniref:Uncharacterized protein n=1 Tax=Bifidobacterium adolescentis L2-32 TaxID=411481 RepID=A7A3E7_BIFAD|nr:hypothetical protein BIFADO_00337 [Bifidobacterium adolescentis L2-32]
MNYDTFANREAPKPTISASPSRVCLIYNRRSRYSGNQT